MGRPAPRARSGPREGLTGRGATGWDGRRREGGGDGTLSRRGGGQGPGRSRHPPAEPGPAASCSRLVLRGTVPPRDLRAPPKCSLQLPRLRRRPDPRAPRPARRPRGRGAVAAGPALPAAAPLSHPAGDRREVSGKSRKSRSRVPSQVRGLDVGLRLRSSLLPREGAGEPGTPPHAPRVNKAETKSPSGEGAGSCIRRGSHLPALQGSL